ncbi:MAG TPA: penicillin-binding protein activator [Usitatibacter sp.]
MSRFNAILLAVLASLVTPAFSADPPTGTTAASASSATIDPVDIDPATGLARSSVVKPLGDMPAVPSSVPKPVAPARVAEIALILPTTSPTLGRLADAVRRGFSAAVEAAGKEGPPVNVTAIDNETTALLDACRDAQVSGARLVVGGITRDGATALAKGNCTRGPVLTLNEPQATASELPPNLYMISPSLENEARQVALMAVADGFHSAVLIASASPLAKRVQDAFEREWTRDAGQVVARITFTGTADDAPIIREKLAGVNADMVFMALDQPEARAVRPYVSAMLPLFATSMSVNPRAETIVNLDLQGMRYEEMPWFVQPDHPAVMVYPVPRSIPIEEERLYAFGIDAYRIAAQLLRGDKAAPIDGVTGKLTLDPPAQYMRTLTPAEIDGGRVIPLRSP